MMPALFPDSLFQSRFDGLVLMIIDSLLMGVSLQYLVAILQSVRNSCWGL